MLCLPNKRSQAMVRASHLSRTSYHTRAFLGEDSDDFFSCLCVFLPVSCQQNVSRESTAPAAPWTACASTTAPATGSRAVAAAPRASTATPASTVSGDTLGAGFLTLRGRGASEHHVNTSPEQLKCSGCCRSPSCFQI